MDGVATLLYLSQLSTMYVCYLIQEILAVWSVGLNHTPNFVNTTMKTTGSNELRQLPVVEESDLNSHKNTCSTVHTIRMEEQLLKY